MIKFGPAGNSVSFYEQGYKYTYQSMKWIADMGLSAYEYSAGKGVKISSDTCNKIRDEAEKYNITISMHAPYYINLANADPEKKEKSVGYILESLKALKAMGGNRLVFHCGAYMGKTAEQAGQMIEEQLINIIKLMNEQGFGNMYLCPETLGKKGQFGTVAEIISICRISKQLIPCIDFAHVYARSLGQINSTQQFEEILQNIADNLGIDRMKKLHIHFTHIEYTASGEKMHRTLSETNWGPNFIYLAQALINKKCKPVIICESKGNMAEDAALMRKIYNVCAI